MKKIVLFGAGQIAELCHFYFSRLDDISMDDKQVSFSTKLGPMEIKTKFILKDMLYHGKLAV